MAGRQCGGNSDGQRDGDTTVTDTNGDKRRSSNATVTTVTAMDGPTAPQRQGTARRLLGGDGQHGTVEAQCHGRHNDNSMVMDSGAQ